MVQACKKIAIVDDDLSVRRGLRRLLETEGYEVLTFASAEEFRDRQMEASVDVLLLDIHLPGMSGLELFELIERDGMGPPTVLMTAHFDAEKTASERIAGSSFCLRKPCNQEDLLAAIARILESKRD